MKKNPTFRITAAEMNLKEKHVHFSKKTDGRLNDHLPFSLIQLLSLKA